jgi:p-aminobenzoyl-glutamate transporter AbgT
MKPKTMKLEKRNSDKNKLAKKVNKVKKSDNSNLKWWIEKVAVPIAIALIPALIPLATTYINTQNTQQQPNPAIDRPIPPSK